MVESMLRVIVEKKSRVQRVVDLCREVRLGLLPNTPVGTILDGWNTIDDQYEQWRVTTTSSVRENIYAIRIDPYSES